MYIERTETVLVWDEMESCDENGTNNDFSVNIDLRDENESIFEISTDLSFESGYWFSLEQLTHVKKTIDKALSIYKKERKV